MASGPLAGGGVSMAKHKWSDGGKKLLKRSKPTIAARQERPIPLVSSSNSLGSEDNHHDMIKISLSSISKLEARNLKRKLQAELDQVRSLINRLQPQYISPETLVPNKKLKTVNKGGHGAADKSTVQVMKNCNNLLGKLMKHKVGWVFNTPVDVKRLGLHDYFTIVKKPMDLGTVKSKLGKSEYKSPLKFAEDVRLTFNNAMLYNPKGHEVHRMAEILLNIFEEKWAPLETQYELLNRRQPPASDIEFHAPVSTNTPYVDPLPLETQYEFLNRRQPPARDIDFHDHVSTNTPCVDSLPLPASTPSLSPHRPTSTVVENRTLERAESMTNLVEPVVVVPDKPEEEEASGNRDLTFDEKRRLSEDLQDLPFDKLEEVVQIIKKRNPELTQHDDEIELDIDSLDLETLWELYRFVTEYKENSSKKKEDAESVRTSVQEANTLVTGLESSKATELGHVGSPVRQEVNAGGSSSSNSSSSGSGSCSSDSDSDSSRHRSDNGN